MEIRMDRGFADYITTVLHPLHRAIQHFMLVLKSTSEKPHLTVDDGMRVSRVLTCVQVDMQSQTKTSEPPKTALYLQTMIHFGAIDILVKLLKSELHDDGSHKRHPQFCWLPLRSRLLRILYQLLRIPDANPKLARLGRDGQFLGIIIRQFAYDRTLTFAQKVLQLIVAHHRQVLDLYIVPDIVSEIAALNVDSRLELCHTLSEGPLAKTIYFKEHRYMRVTTYSQQTTANQKIWLAVPNLIAKTVQSLDRASPKYDAIFHVLRLFMQGNDRQVWKQISAADFGTLVTEAFADITKAYSEMNRDERVSLLHSRHDSLAALLSCVERLPCMGNYRYLLVSQVEFHGIVASNEIQPPERRADGLESLGFKLCPKPISLLSMLLHITHSNFVTTCMYYRICIVVTNFLRKGSACDQDFVLRRISISLNVNMILKSPGAIPVINLLAAVMKSNFIALESFSDVLDEPIDSNTSTLKRKKFIRVLEKNPVTMAPLIRSLIVTSNCYLQDHLRINTSSLSLRSLMGYFYTNKCHDDYMRRAMLGTLKWPIEDLNRESLVTAVTLLVTAMKRGRLAESLKSLVVYKIGHANLMTFQSKLELWKDEDLQNDKLQMVVRGYISAEDVEATVSDLLSDPIDQLIARRKI